MSARKPTARAARGGDTSRPTAILDWIVDNSDVLIPVVVALVVYSVTVTRYDIPTLLHDAYAYTMSALRLVRDGVYAYAGGELPGVAVRADAKVTPGYILWLSSFYALLGRSGDAISTVKAVQPIILTAQFVASLGGVAMLALSGRELGGKRLALLTGLLASVYLPFAWATSVTLSESIMMPLLAAQLLMTLKITARAATWRTPWLMFLYGVLTAVIVMVRPSTAAWIIVPLVYVVLTRPETWKRLAVLAGICALGFVLVFTPWWIRNAVLIGKFVPLRTDMVKAAGGGYESVGNEAPPVLTPEQRLATALAITRAPWSAVDDVLWENNFHPDKMRVDFGPFPTETHNRIVPLMQLMSYYQTVLMLLAVAALFFVRRSPRLLMVATMPIYTIAVHYTTQLNPRYAYLAWPAMIIMAAAGGYALWMLARKRLAHR